MEQKKQPSKRSGGVHAGHRQRVRQRFLKTGLEHFQDHEVLEFLLFYAIPRRDVNETAHLLLNRFGSLPGVLDASEEELCEIPGVGPSVAHFLNLIPEILVQTARLKCQSQSVILRAPQDLLDILARRQIAFPLGQILLILIDSLFQVVSMHTIESFQNLTLHAIVQHTANSRASRVILAERVEDREDLPEPGRLLVLNDLAKKMRMLDMPLGDYYAVDFSGRPPRSYRQYGQLLPQ